MSKKNLTSCGGAVNYFLLSLRAATPWPPSPVPTAVVVLAHAVFEFPDGRVDVRNLADGPHALIVGARDHVGQARRFVIRDGGTRNFEIVLPLRAE